MVTIRMTKRGVGGNLRGWAFRRLLDLIKFEVPNLA